MPIESLDRSILEQIVSLLPDYLIYRLLKSKILAKTAYDVYYKDIVIDTNEIIEFPLKIQTNYKQVNPSESALSQSDSRIRPSFANGESVVKFCKAHPLYGPNTLWYKEISELESMHKAMPGLLTKFKGFVKVGPSKKEIVPSFDYKSLKHDVYYCGSDASVPVHIKKVIFKEFPAVVMSTVESVQITGTFDTKDLKFELFPNLTELSCSLKGDVCLKIPKLKKLKLQAAETGKIDLSLCGLEHLEVSNVHERSIGVDDSFDLRLPLSLKKLSLSLLLKKSQWQHLAPLIHLKTLILDSRIPYTLGSTMTGFEIPPNLYDLSLITWGELSWTNTEIPKSLRAVRLSGPGIDLSHFFPEDANLETFDGVIGEINTKAIQNMKQLSRLSCKMGSRQYGGLPPYLTYLYVVDSYGISSFKSLKYLTTLNQRLDTGTRLKQIELPPSIRELNWTTVKADTVINYENLVRLSLSSCDVNLKFDKMTKLQILHLGRTPKVDYTTLPSSLQALTILGVEIKGGLTCPKNLRYLEMNGCVLKRGNIVLNPVLEVLCIQKVKCDFNKVLKSAGKYLHSVHIATAEKLKLDVDLSHTRLEYFFVLAKSFESKKAKFPKSLDKVITPPAFFL